MLHLVDSLSGCLGGLFSLRSRQRLRVGNYTISPVQSHMGTFHVLNANNGESLLCLAVHKVFSIDYYRDDSRGRRCQRDGRDKEI